MKKTNDNLTIKGLNIRYDVAACGTTKFEAALEDGTILADIQRSADAGCNGQLIMAVRQLKRNCASQRCHRKDRDVVTTADANLDRMVDMFDEFLTGLAAKESGASRSTRKFYTYSKEEMESMEPSQLKALDNCLRSWYSNNGYTVEQVGPDKAELFSQVEAWAAVLKDVRATKGEAAKAKPTVSEGLMAKLSTGKGASLSKAQVEELLKLIQG